MKDLIKAEYTATIQVERNMWKVFSAFRNFHSIRMNGEAPCLSEIQPFLNS